MFAQKVAPMPDRPAQWEAILAARANNRRCHVFEDPADFMSFSLEVPYPHERN
jgi:hypothetical protein